MKPLSGENAPDGDHLEVALRALVELDARQRSGPLRERRASRRRRRSDSPARRRAARISARAPSPRARAGSLPRRRRRTRAPRAWRGSWRGSPPWLVPVSTDDLGALGRLVRVVDAGEVLDLAGERLLVEPLRVALGERRDRASQNTSTKCSIWRALLVADRAVRADRRGHRAGARAGDELGDVADAADVGVAVLLARS